MLRDSQDLEMPLPSKQYSSPLARCLETTRLAFGGLQDSEGGSRSHPMIKELLRERLGRHTCDRRSPRSWIGANFPEFNIETGFTEEDQLWDRDRRETAEEHVVRIKKLLDDIFSNEPAQIISFTCHSGAIRALYEAIHHREVWVAAGAVMPVLIKANLVA
jgi:broad specificity phosphatase PhoE